MRNENERGNWLPTNNTHTTGVMIIHNRTELTTATNNKTKKDHIPIPIPREGARRHGAPCTMHHAPRGAMRNAQCATRQSPMHICSVQVQVQWSLCIIITMCIYRGHWNMHIGTFKTRKWIMNMNMKQKKTQLVLYKAEGGVGQLTLPLVLLHPLMLLLVLVVVVLTAYCGR
jgi:hypothetical protein